MYEPLALEEQEPFLKSLIVTDTDRSPPHEFVGRQEELEWLDGKLDRAMDGKVGLSCVVEGIPGIGKTSLVKQFCDNARERGAITLIFEPEELKYPIDVARRMADCVFEFGTEQDKKAIREATDTFRGLSGGVTVLGSGAQFGMNPQASNQYTKPTSPIDVSLASGVSIFGIPKNTPFVLFVDEAQRLGDDSRRTVGKLQLGLEGYKILPVYAGVRGRAAAKVSRLCSGRLASGSKRDLWLLDDKDIETSIWRTCRKAGIALEPLGRLAKDLAHDCEGFARHILSALSGMAQVELKLRKRRKTIGLEDIHQCRKEASISRDDYYSDRLGAVFFEKGMDGLPYGLLATLAGPCESAKGAPVAVKNIRRMYEAELLKWDEQGDDLQLDRVLSDCQQAGMLETNISAKTGQRMFRFLTPSLVSYILRNVRGASHQDDL